MIDTSWRIEDPDPGDVPVGAPSSGFVSMHFLRATLRRRWLVLVASAMAGLLLGLGYTLAVPAKVHGTATILLAHDPGVDPTTAMTTDISLLRTRAVATAVIDDLGLHMTPEAFQASVTPVPSTPTVLVLDVAAPDSAAAVARVRALARDYLAFRGNQLEVQSKALADGYQKRINAMKAQVATLTAQYNQASSQGAVGQNDASDALTQRAQLESQISQLQQQMDDATLDSESLVAASHVMDQPSVVPASSLKRIVLNTGAGFIAGLAIGVGAVLVVALTSGRLRRRDEVGLALGSPVRFSAGRVSGRRRWTLRRRRSSPERELEVLVQGLGSAVTPHKNRQSRLALLAVDTADDAARVLAGLGTRLAGEGSSVLLVDLSAEGRLAAHVSKSLERLRRTGEHPVEPALFRPEGEPRLARGPLGGSTAAAQSPLAQGGPLHPLWEEADVVLTLADVDPAVGVDHLTSWAQHAVLLVAAGRSSAERLRTTGELVRSAHLQLAFTMLVDAEPSDESSGRTDPHEPGWSPRAGTPG